MGNPLPIVGGSHTARSSFFDAQRTVNMYPEVGKSGTSKTIAMLIGCPGLILWTNLPGGTIRGALRFSDNVSLFVSGPYLYSVNASAVYTLIGPIDLSNDPVGMASNGTTVMIVTGGLGYFYTPGTGVFSQINDPNFLGADSVDFLDGYFIFNRPGTGNFQFVGPYNTVFNGADIGTSEGSPDLLMAILVSHREAWMFNQSTTEVFFNSGNPDSPIERIQGAFIEHGCAARFSPAKMDNTVFWLSADDRGKGVVRKAVGYQDQRISNHSFEYAIAKYTDISDAIGYTYQQEGHSFYVLNFPSADATWCYDSTTDEWHERAYRVPATGALARHRSNCHLAFAGKTLVGDHSNGNVYVMDLDTFTDNGDILPAIRQTPYIHANSNFVFFYKLCVDMEVGVGTVTGQGVNPTMMLNWSDDGGKTWPREMSVSIGKIGERNARAVFRRLGKSRARVFRLTITDPVRRIIIGASLDSEMASS